MPDFRFLQANTDPSFALKSFAEYSDKRAKNNEEYTLAILAGLEADTPDEGLIIFSQMTDLSPDIEIYLGEGKYGTARSIITDGVNGLNLYAGDEDTEPTLALDEVSISGISFPDVISNLKEALFNAYAVAASAYAQSMDGFVAKLTAFKDRMSRVFDDTTTTVSSAYSYFSDIFAQNLPDADFLSSLSSFLQAEQASQADDSTSCANMIYQSDAEKYLGVSPLAALTVGGVAGKVGATLVAGAKVVCGVLVAVGKAIGKGFRWLKRKANEAFLDPLDLYQISDEGDPTVQSFSIQKKGIDNTGPLTSFRIPYRETNPLSYSYSAVMDYYNYYGALKNKTKQWATFDLGTVFVCLRFDSLGIEQYDDASVSMYPSVKGLDYIVYPKIIKGNISNLPGGFTCSFTPGSYVHDVYLVTNIANRYMVTDRYADSTTFENDLLNGMLNGIEYAKQVALATFWRNYRSSSAYAQSGDLLTISYSPTDYVGSNTVTNKDFFKAATGIGDFSFPISIDYDESVTKLVGLLAILYATSLYDESVNPLDFEWLPYRTGASGAPSGKWSIKTDEENANAVEVFIAAMIVIAAALVFSVAARKLVKKLQVNRFFKRQSQIENMEKDMAFGATLTDKQRRKYLRLVRKNNAMQSCYSGLAASSSNSSIVSTISSNISGSSSDFSEIKTLITG